MTSLVLLVLVVLFAVAVLAKTVRIVPQARAGIVERFGKYKASLPAGLNIVVPFVDKVRYMIDLREQVVSFPPQPVITEDNLVVSIDTVIYFQVTDPVAATYEIANYIQAVEQLTMTTLRNIVGGMDLEQALTSRDEINNRLRGVLDEATGKWGIRVNRVELKGIDPPPSIKDSMEKQMRADRDKRAAILTAEGQRQSAILTAEGGKQAAILNAEGDRESLILRAQADRESRILKAQGEGQAIQTVFQAIHDGRPGPVAAGLPVPPDDAEDRRGRRQQGVDRAQRDRQGARGPRLDDEQPAGIPDKVDGPRTRVDMGPTEPDVPADATLQAHPRGGGRRDRGRRGVEQPAGPPEPDGQAPWRLRREPPRRSAGRQATPGSPPLSDLPGDGGDLPRGDRRRHHQHRGGVGNADHVPDPSRDRGPAGDRQRVEHPRARARLAVRARSATAASWPGSGRRLLRLGAGSVLGGVAGRGAAAGAARRGVQRDRAGADRARRACWWSSSRRSAGAWRPAPSRAASSGPSTARCGCGCWSTSPGVYGGYFGAAQGVLLMAILGVGLTETMQRNNATKNVLALLVNLVAAIVFIFVADIDYRVAAIIAVGSVIGGQIGATVGRRLPPWALRGVHRRGRRRGAGAVPRASADPGPPGTGIVPRASVGEADRAEPGEQVVRDGRRVEVGALVEPQEQVGGGRLEHGHTVRRT